MRAWKLGNLEFGQNKCPPTSAQVGSTSGRSVGAGTAASGDLLLLLLLLLLCCTLYTVHCALCCCCCCCCCLLHFALLVSLVRDKCLKSTDSDPFRRSNGRIARTTIWFILFIQHIEFIALISRHAENLTGHVCAVLHSRKLQCYAVELGGCELDH